MRTSFRKLVYGLMAGVAACALCPSVASAQVVNEEAGETSSAPADVVVVTGTLIRGIAPAGANVIGLSEQAVEESGGTTTGEVLATVPQIGNMFATVPAGVSPVAGSNATNPITRPNLRSLPAANTSGGAQTLVLLDGHRVVGAGTEQIAIDPDIFAPDAIMRVEAMTDGGSAVYGSDALGGVLNFMTLNRFDGAKVRARVGFGDNYESRDGGVILGKDWDSGGGYVAYNYSFRDTIFGSDRDYAKRIDWDTGVPVGRNCADPNVTVNGASYVVSGSNLAAGGPNVCDPTDDTALFPESEQHNVFAKFNQDLTSNLRFDVSALWANRKSTGNNGTVGLNGNTTGTLTVSPANPFYRDTGDANAGLDQTVLFNYAPALGARSLANETELDTWSVTPTLTYDLGQWQIRGLANYGESKTSYENVALVAAAQAAAFAAGDLNPYDIGSISTDVLAGLLGADYGYSKDKFTNFRVIADGPVFSLPAGDVHMAVGAETMKTEFERLAVTAGTPNTGTVNYDQDVKSVFAEFQIPVMAADSGTGKIDLSVSGRYDEYNDFGNTTNPKIGLTWAPVDWIRLRGNWGKSFNAPTAVDQLGPLTSIAAPIPANFLQTPPGVTIQPGEFGVFLGRGSAPGLEPQKADNWSIGVNFEPPAIEGLSVDVSYYNIELEGTIGRPVTGAILDDYFANFPDLYLVRPTGAQLHDFLSQVTTVVSFTEVNPTDTVNQAQICLAPAAGGGCNFAAPVVEVLDTLTRNLGTTKIDGVDWDVNYQMDTGFGSMDFRFAGNYRLSQDSKASPTAMEVDELEFGISKYSFVTSVGANIGEHMRAQASWYYKDGYDRATPEFGQMSVDSFDSMDLYFRYDVNGSGIGRDLAFTLNVANLFDQDPPAFRSTGQPGYDPNLGFTLGRVFRIGVEKKF